MSVINQKPFIETILESLTELNLNSLITLVNGGATSTKFRSFTNPTYALSTNDKGMNHIVLETRDKVFTGYLIYTDSVCVLVAYDNDKAQRMYSVQIDYSNSAYTIINEALDINEFRRLLEGRVTTIEVEANDVVANPTLAGTENKLESISIDGTKFKVDTLPTPEDSTKTYILKCVAGVYTLVEES